VGGPLVIGGQASFAGKDRFGVKFNCLLPKKRNPQLINMASAATEGNAPLFSMANINYQDMPGGRKHVPRKPYRGGGTPR